MTRNTVIEKAVREAKTPPSKLSPLTREVSDRGAAEGQEPQREEARRAGGGAPKQTQIASQPVRGHRNRPLGCFVHKPNGRDGARKQRFGLAVRCALLAQQFVHGLLID